tara:strand:- start:705 stop:1133 length:429 start_codon:yes stop_codon:yes gene_type:complete
VSFGYTVLGFGGFANRSTVLAASITSASPSDGSQLSISAVGGATTHDSSSGDIDCTVTATGGSGSYTYSWSLVEADDPDGVVSILANGTTNAARYQNGRLRITYDTTGPHPPPQGALYQARCVVSDGSSSVTVDSNFSVELV